MANMHSSHLCCGEKVKNQKIEIQKTEADLEGVSVAIFTHTPHRFSVLSFLGLDLVDVLRIDNYSPIRKNYTSTRSNPQNV
jgi:hypothetical protein